MSPIPGLEKWRQENQQFLKKKKQNNLDSLQHRHWGGGRREIRCSRFKVTLPLVSVSRPIKPTEKAKPFVYLKMNSPGYDLLPMNPTWRLLPNKRNLICLECLLLGCVGTWLSPHWREGVTLVEIKQPGDSFAGERWFLFIAAHSPAAGTQGQSRQHDQP